MTKENAKADPPEEYGNKLKKIIEEFGLDMDTENLSSLEETNTDTDELVEKVKKMSQEIQTEQEKKSKHEEDIKADSLMNQIESHFEYEDTYKKEKETVDDHDTVLDPIHTPVYLNYRAYKRMVGYAQRYANKNLDMKNWKEVYGILIGTVEEKTLVVIKDALPIVVGGPTGVELEPIHYVDLSQIDASIYEKAIQDKKTDFVIGWWHTHPGFGYFFSEVDSYTHLGYQIPNPYAVGLIYDHCEHREDFLGVAGLRLTEPDEGLLSDYKTIELHFDRELEEINPKIKKLVDKIAKNMDNVLEQLNYVENTLRKKALAQLQRNYGLILVPKRDIKVVDDEEEAEEDEDKLYIWDPDFYKKSYRIPKFREKIENEILNCEIILKELLEKEQMKKFEEKKEKFRKKIQKMLEKANEWYELAMEDYKNKVEVIYPFYDYLDTTERKKMENFEERIGEYYNILECLNIRSEFNLEKKT